jgi:outer membrane murein-binding lipoprotein Lpp
MDTTLDGKLMERQLASLDELFSNLAREAGVNPSAPPASIKTSRAPLATSHRLANWRYVAFVGSLLAASIGGAVWWWSSSAHTAMMAPSDPAPLTQAAPEAVAPKDAAPTAVALDLAQQLQPMTRDLAALKQAVEQLKVRQEQLARDNENVASQLKASQEEMARNNNIIEQIKATQIQIARESETVTERLNASQEQLARVIANASEPKVMPEEPKVSPEEPKVMPEIPLPRPRQSANVGQTQKLAPTPARPQAKKPQPSLLAWPWSVR